MFILTLDVIPCSPDSSIYLYITYCNGTSSTSPVGTPFSMTRRLGLGTGPSK
jgi:hypothetical protein